MPDLLLELFCEEIPARMQARAADDLKRLVTDGLVEAGLTYEGARALATPRRLALTVQGVTARSRDVAEERKGPRVGAPPQAVEGFLRAAGLTSLDQAEVRSEPKKGEFYVAVVTRPGRAAEEIVAELVPRVVRAFPWPKSMRWGARSAPPGTPFSPPDAEGTASLRWVRPLRSILCTFGPETEEPEVVGFEVGGVVAGDLTYGHRFLSVGPIQVKRFDDYMEKLDAAYVVADPERRRAIIETEAKNLAFARGLELVEDAALLDEVAGLVEWPVVLMGAFDPAFLSIPEEVIRLTIRNNQKCFVTRRTDGPSGLADRFILVANIEAADGGAAIVAGNERVVAARLSDARFFWEQDLKVPLEEQAKKLDAIVFHEKLGTQGERVERVARLARGLAPLVGADPDDAERAARLAKADLVTGMVGEFPELQGVMGRYYVLAQNGLLPGTANAPHSSPSPLAGEGGPRVSAGRERGEPQGTDGDAQAPSLGSPATYPAHAPGKSGRGPSQGAGRSSLPATHRVAGSGSAGPLLTLPREGGEGEQAARIRAIADAVRDHYRPQGPNDAVPSEPVSVAVALADKLDMLVGFWAIDEKPTGSKDPYALRRAALGVIRILWANELNASIRHFVQLHFEHGYSCEYIEIASEIDNLCLFFEDRLEQQLRDQGAPYQLLEAVLAKQSLIIGSPILHLIRRVEALGNLLDTEDGKNLLVGYRRAANILRVEEKRDGRAYDEPPDRDLVHVRGQAEERALLAVIESVEAHVEKHLELEDFEGAMRSLAELRPAVDAFFDCVTVNADDPQLRENRLRLLNRIRQAMHKVADFSRIAG